MTHASRFARRAATACAIALSLAGCTFGVDGVPPLGDDIGGDQAAPRDGASGDSAALDALADAALDTSFDGAGLDGALDLAGSDGGPLDGAPLDAPADALLADAAPIDAAPPVDATVPADLTAAPDLFACKGDGDCAGVTPRCDTATGRCVPCLPTGDNCASGSYCVAGGGTYACQPGCKGDAECKASGPATSACCAHVCVNTASDAQNCGGCGVACPLPNHASGVACQAKSCVLTGCSGSYADCNMTFSDGCEVDTSSDPMHCGSCSTSCSSNRCGKSVAATFQSDPSALWSFNGDAHYSGTFKDGILTDFFNQNSAGAIVYKDKILVDEFDASFDVWLGLGGSSGADGMGFFIAADGAGAVGGSGGQLGMGGLTGFGVEFDTYNNGICGDTQAPHIAVDALDTCNGGLKHLTENDSPPTFRNANWHTVTVHFDHGTWTVTLDGTTVVNAVDVGAFTPDLYWFGFGGGTGGTTDSHAIRNVAITFPTPRCL